MTVEELVLAIYMKWPLFSNDGVPSNLSGEIILINIASWSSYSDIGWQCKEIEELRKTKLMKLIF